MCIIICLSGCASSAWNGETIDVVDAVSFAGEFVSEELKPQVTVYDAALWVDLVPCGESQCADVWFDGILTNGSITLEGPAFYEISGITIEAPEVWVETELDGNLIRAKGEFFGKKDQLWLELFVRAPIVGFVNFATITLDETWHDDTELTDDEYPEPLQVR